MESSTTNTTTPPAAGASKRRRKAAQPLGDLTNLLPSTPAPRNPSAKQPLRPPRSDASLCSSSASATPVSKAASAAAVEEPGLVKSPISTIYTSRGTRGRRNPTSVKAPFPTGAAASCPPLGKATRASSIAWSRAPAMDGDGFDVWGSQPSASGPATQAGLDLNSQASASEGFPGLGLYGDATTTHHDKFPHPPPGKYYVVDAGYPNRPGYLSPYRCTRYHVEQWQNGPPPQGMKETFNHAHAKVRNVIERSFGVLKMKFRILLNMPKFTEDKQSRIIVACMALHNFIRESRIADREFDACDADENYNPMPSSCASAWPEDEPLVEDTNMNVFRNELAHALFHGM